MLTAPMHILLMRVQQRQATAAGAGTDARQLGQRAPAVAAAADAQQQERGAAADVAAAADAQQQELLLGAPSAAAMQELAQPAADGAAAAAEPLLSQAQSRGLTPADLAQLLVQRGNSTAFGTDSSMHAAISSALGLAGEKAFEKARPRRDLVAHVAALAKAVADFAKESAPAGTCSVALAIGTLPVNYPLVVPNYPESGKQLQFVDEPAVKSSCAASLAAFFATLNASNSSPLPIIAIVQPMGGDAVFLQHAVRLSLSGSNRSERTFVFEPVAA